MVNENATQVCKSCGKELPIEMFRMSSLGRYRTCKACTRDHQILGHMKKREAELSKARAEKERKLGLKDYTPRELMAELKRRGYSFKMEYVETHIIDSKDIEV